MSLLKRKSSTSTPGDTAAPPPPPIQLAPAGPVQVQRGIRFPQLLISLLVVGLFGLLGLWWQSSTAARAPVVGLATAVSQGQTIEAENLTTIYVSTDGGVVAATTSADFLDLFVGKVANTDLEMGTLVNGSMFQTTTPLAPGEAFVGMELPSNHFPGSIVPGDLVDVLILDGEGSDTELSFDEPATVEAVTPNRQGGRTRIRLRMDEFDAVEVQRAAADDDVVLIEVLDRSAA